MINIKLFVLYIKHFNNPNRRLLLSLYKLLFIIQNEEKNMLIYYNNMLQCKGLCRYITKHFKCKVWRQTVYEYIHKHAPSTIITHYPYFFPIYESKPRILFLKQLIIKLR